jgi:hypothetical protein
MLQHLGKLVYGMRLLELIERKDLELFGKGILLQLFIGYLTRLSTSMHMSAIKRLAKTLQE